MAQLVGRRHQQVPELVGGLRSLDLTAERRAILKVRIISTRPSALLGSPAVSPASSARAAFSASRKSELLPRWRWRRLGLSTSVTGIAAVLR